MYMYHLQCTTSFDQTSIKVSIELSRIEKTHVTLVRLREVDRASIKVLNYVLNSLCLEPTFISTQPKLKT
jgi:hypothetical protein